MLTFWWCFTTKYLNLLPRIEFFIRRHPLSTYAKFSEKLTFLNLWDTCAHQGVRNVSFSENFAYVLNGWTLTTNQFAAKTKRASALWFENGNTYDMFAVKTVDGNSRIVGHLLREILRITKFIIDRGASKHSNYTNWNTLKKVPVSERWSWITL